MHAGHKEAQIFAGATCMSLLQRLFTAHRPLRHFALLDAQGRCRALRQCRERPASGHWVQIHEPHLPWLGQPLPASARVETPARPADTAHSAAA